VELEALGRTGFLYSYNGYIKILYSAQKFSVKSFILFPVPSVPVVIFVREIKGF
jgi:hypothetical protein